MYLTKDEKLRFELVKQAGFSLIEVPLVYQYIKGDDNALNELKAFQDFQEWKTQKRFMEVVKPSRQENISNYD